MTGAEHRVLREQLGAYALGQLTGPELGAVRAHLQTCPGCRDEVTALVPVAAMLRGVDPDRLEQAPPAAPALSAAVLREVRTGRRGVVRAAGGRARHAMLLAAAAVATVLAASGIGYGLGVGAATRPAGEPVPVQTIAQQVQANATLVPHTWGMEVRLTAAGFAPGQTYRVSVTDRAGRTVSAGEFLGTGDAEMRCNLNSSVLRADATSFQVRDAGGDLVLAATL